MEVGSTGRKNRNERVVVVDFGSFTWRRLLVDGMHSADTWGEESKHGKGRGCKTREEEQKDRETTHLSMMVT